MPSTGLKGPFLLTAERVNIAVTRALPGAYALGHTDTGGNVHRGHHWTFRR